MDNVVNPNKLEAADFIRGWSMVAIVLFHLILMLKVLPIPKIVMLASNFGGAGVHAFILCSGFGLFLSQLRRPLRYKDFLLKRLLRVQLPFVIIVLVTFCIPFETGAFNMKALLANIFMYKMFMPEYNTIYGMQMWFVSMIIQFYLLFPVFVYLFNRLGGKCLFVNSLIVSILWGGVVASLGKSDIRVWNSFFLQYLWEFVLGMNLAKYFIDHPIHLPKKGCIMLIAAICIPLTGIMGYLGGVFKLFNDIPSLFGFVSVGLFVFALKINKLNAFFEFVNTFSYEWYLVHILVFDITFHFLGMNGVSVMIAPIMSFILGYLFHILMDLLVGKKNFTFLWIKQ